MSQQVPVTSQVSAPEIAQSSSASLLTSPAAPTTTATASGSRPSSSSQHKIVVHHLENSRSQRILWLLEYLDVSYEVKQYKRVKERAPDSLLAIHPLGKSPVITDGPDVTVAESGAIIEYIVAKYDTAHKLQPKTDLDARANTFFMHYAEGSIIPPLVMKRVLDAAAPQVPWLVRPVFNGINKALDAQYITPECKRNFTFVERTLEKTEWFAGEAMTGSDFQMSFPMEIAGRVGFTETQFPKVFAWRKKVAAMDSYQRALKAGGMDYAFAL